jgi:aminomethyltransferase
LEVASDADIDFTKTHQVIVEVGYAKVQDAEMTCFGMQPSDFAELAGLIAEVVKENSDVKSQVIALRSRFLELHYCFKDDEALEMLHGLV